MEINLKALKLDNQSMAPAEYCQLRLDCGLSKRTLESARIALENSLHTVCLRYKDRLAGMGRVVGDQGCHVLVVDIAVHPDFQKRGLSHRIMDNIMAYIDTNVPHCATVGLFADIDFLYHKYGFYQPSESSGMWLDRHFSKTD